MRCFKSETFSTILICQTKGSPVFACHLASATTKACSAVMRAGGSASARSPSLEISAPSAKVDSSLILSYKIVCPLISASKTVVLLTATATAHAIMNKLKTQKQVVQAKCLSRHNASAMQDFRMTAWTFARDARIHSSNIPTASQSDSGWSIQLITTATTCQLRCPLYSINQIRASHKSSNSSRPATFTHSGTLSLS